jgi:hypothetical protein
LGIVPSAFAGIAGDPNVGQKVHFDFQLSCAFAFFAASAGNVKTETPGRVSPNFGFGKLSEEFPDLIEYAGVRCRIGSRSETDGLLIDADDFIKIFDSFDGIVCAGLGICPMERFGKGFPENIVDEGTFSASAHAGNNGERTERKGSVNVFEVIMFCSANDEPMQGLLIGVWFGGT